jgi:hypothetical protein
MAQIGSIKLAVLHHLRPAMLKQLDSSASTETFEKLVMTHYWTEHSRRQASIK